MRVSRLFLRTLREDPADAEVISHRLMLRAGLIRQLTTGIYTWLPLGLRVLQKTISIVREEMDKAGAIELLMPGVQPTSLWQESGRLQNYGPELLRFSDRHLREFCIGPTHEEVITDLLRHEVKSYRQLPLLLYQVQTKFRDEIRPRFGIMRAREFLMKDAYSFHANEASLNETYQVMYDAYSRIFQRLGLAFRAVLADGGNIGGHISHEFHVLAESGEDRIGYTEDGSFAANLQLIPCVLPDGMRAPASQHKQCVATPGVKTIADVASFLGVETEQCVKTLILMRADGGMLAVLLRGDHELNSLKAERIPGILRPLRFADAEAIEKELHCPIGSLGPVALNLPIVADHAVATMSDFICGANQSGKHLTGVNAERDFTDCKYMDLRLAVVGDPALSADGVNAGGSLAVARGIEVGHVFQLGEKYSRAFNATFLDETGRAKHLIMGCYGIGVSRIVAAAIEQHNDTKGICWPLSMAPYQVIIIPVNIHNSENLRDHVMALYESLQKAGFEVLLDDRKERPGVMFSDAELIGIPHRLTVSERHIAQDTVEYKKRSAEKSEVLSFSDVVSQLHRRILE